MDYAQIQTIVAILALLAPVFGFLSKLIGKRFDEQQKKIDAQADDLQAAEKSLAEFKLKVAEQYVLKSELSTAVEDIKRAMRDGFTDLKKDVEKVELIVERQLDLFRKEIS